MIGEFKKHETFTSERLFTRILIKDYVKNNFRILLLPSSGWSKGYGGRLFLTMS